MATIVVFGREKQLRHGIRSQMVLNASARIDAPLSAVVSLSLVKTWIFMGAVEKLTVP